jgi:integrase
MSSYVKRRSHGDGSIDTRGPDRYRLRWRVGHKRYTKTIRGSVTEVKRELRRLLKSVDDGQHVAPDKVTVAAYLQSWLNSDHNLSPKTLERYRQLVDLQIIPHLGTIALQRLRPQQVEVWHHELLKKLAARTVGHAHRVLHRGLERAVKLEILSRNVAHAVPPPTVERKETKILTAEQIGGVLQKLQGHSLHSIIALAVNTGMRRGELVL